MIRRFGVLRLWVNGFSMSSVDRDVYRPGDVVLYIRNGRLFVHRLVEMAGEAVVTRGDALLGPDPPVRAGDLLGRVVSIERGGSSITVPREVGWGRRVAGAVLGQSGRLVRMSDKVLNRG